MHGKGIDKKTEFLGEFEDTTLQERLNAIEGDPVIFLGAESGFFFIGPKSELLTQLDNIFAQMIAEMKRKRTETVNGLASSRGRLAAYIEELSTLDTQSWEMTTIRHISQLGADVKNTALRIATLVHRLNFADHYLASQVDLRGRRSRAPYPRMQKDGIVITIEGPERGKYWFAEEYKKDHPSFEIHFPDEAEETEENEDGSNKSLGVGT